MVNADKDRRLYAKFTLSFPSHPKILILSDTAFRCLVEATLWSREQEKDGFLARRLALAKWSLDALQELCLNDPDNPSLIEREEGWYIHDYAEHQETKADIEARRERNRVNGQKGGLARGKRNAKRLAKPTPSNKVSENEAEEEKEGICDFSTPVTPVDATEPPPRCSRHLNHTDPPNCLRCKESRLANEAWHAGELDRRRAARAAAKAESDNCPTCHGTNLIDVGDNEVRKCNHREAM
jgi:hypothetical protein